MEDPALYQTDVYRGKAVDFIRRRSGPGRPFYLSVAFLAPHAEVRAGRPAGGPPCGPAPRHRGKFVSKPLPRPRSFNEADVSDKPAYIRNQATVIGPRRIATITRNFQARQEALLSVDEAVRQIVARCAPPASWPTPT